MDILLVDDNQSVRQEVSAYLTELGHSVVEASNGLTALYTLQKQKFDFIVSDYLMPIMNGIKFFENVLIEKHASAEQLLLLSTKTDEAIDAKLAQFSIKCLAKPVTPTMIASFIGSESTYTSSFNAA